MKLPILFRPEARDEIAHAVEWYDARLPGLGEQFMLRVEEALGRIESNPLVYGIVGQDVRCCLLKQFPYGIYYQIEPTEVLVIAVQHSKRNPTLWKTRTK